MTARKNKPGQGIAPLGQDRGGLVPILVQVYSDQATRLKDEGNQSALIRICLDKFFSDVDRRRTEEGGKEDPTISQVPDGA